MDLTAEQLDAIRAVSAPGMTPGTGAFRFPYRREPYGRAHIPTALGALVVDGKVMFAEQSGPLVNFWRTNGIRDVVDVFIPAAWVQPISREESTWRDVYDLQ